MPCRQLALRYALLRALSSLFSCLSVASLPAGQSALRCLVCTPRDALLLLGSRNFWKQLRRNSACTSEFRRQLYSPVALDSPLAPLAAAACAAADGGGGGSSEGAGGGGRNDAVLLASGHSEDAVGGSSEAPQQRMS